MRYAKLKRQGCTPQRILVTLFQLVILFMPILLLGVEGKNIICTVSFIVNGLIFIIGASLTLKSYAISIELVYWIFMFFFMYFAPLIQYIFSVYPWRGSLTDKDIIAANIIILLFNLVFLAGKWLAKHVRFTGVPKTKITEFLGGNIEFKRKSKTIVSVIVVLLAIYSFSKTGVQGLLVSRVQATKVFYSGTNSAIQLIVESVIPALIAYTVAEAAQNMKAKKENGARFWLLFICMLVCCFPTSLPRYKTITIYGTVFLMLFPKLNKGAKFYLIFVFGLFFAFPLLNGFRYMVSVETLQSVFENGLLEVFVEADYDAYRMLSSAITYTKVNGSVWGRQLLGSLLFFVPRSVWASKPGGSGAMLIRAEFGNNVVSNVSCPYIAEGYLNFGIIGVVLFALFLGSVIYRVDKNYWENNRAKQYIALSPYLYMAFMMFFMLRGDLLSGFAYMCGFVVTGYALKVMSKYI